MKITISGKNIDVTEGLKAAVNEKLGKLEKYFTPDTNVIVTLSVEKERQKIEVTIPVKGNIIRSEQVSNDMYVSIDLVEEVIERQLRKYKTKLADKQQEAGNFQKEYLEHDYLEDEDIQIIRTKKIRHETNVSGRCLRTDGTSWTHLLRIPQCRDRRSKRRLQEKEQHLRSDRAGVLKSK